MFKIRLTAAVAAVALAGGATLAFAIPAAAEDAPPVVASQTEGGASSPESTPPSTTAPAESDSPAADSPDTVSTESGSTGATDSDAPSSSAGTPSEPTSNASTTPQAEAPSPAGKGVVGPITPPTPPTPVEGWWIMPNGGTASNVTWPQTATPANVVPCGTTAQVDTYPSQKVLDKLAADGVLTQGEDSAVVMSWRFVTGPKCGPTEVTVPTLPVTPPTCTADGTLPFLSNPPAQNPNGYEFPGQGFRVYISPAFAGPGVYTATIQKIGAGFDPAFPYGTKVVGNTKQTLTVLPATGFQLTDPEAACYVEPAQPKVEHAEYQTDVCTKPLDGTRTVTLWGVDTTIPQLFDPKTGTFSDGEKVEGDAYIVSTKTVDDADCAVPVVVVPPTNPPTVTPVPQPVIPAAGPAAPFALVASDELAHTGSNVDAAGLLAAGAALLLAAGLGVVGLGAHVRRRRAFAQVMSRLSSIK